MLKAMITAVLRGMVLLGLVSGVLLPLTGPPQAVRSQADADLAPYLYYHSDLAGGMVLERADGTDSRMLVEDVSSPGAPTRHSSLIEWSPSGQYYLWRRYIRELTGPTLDYEVGIGRMTDHALTTLVQPETFHHQGEPFIRPAYDGGIYDYAEWVPDAERNIVFLVAHHGQHQIDGRTYYEKGMYFIDAATGRVLSTYRINLKSRDVFIQHDGRYYQGDLLYLPDRLHYQRYTDDGAAINILYVVDALDGVDVTSQQVAPHQREAVRHMWRLDRLEITGGQTSALFEGPISYYGWLEDSAVKILGDDLAGYPLDYHRMTYEITYRLNVPGGGLTPEQRFQLAWPLALSGTPRDPTVRIVSYSPDGQYALLVKNNAGPCRSVEVATDGLTCQAAWIAARQTGTVHQIADGTVIYTLQREGKFDHLTPLSRVSDLDALWSPDSRYLVLAYGRRNIYAINLTTLEHTAILPWLRQVAPTATSSWDVRWQWWPEGSQLLVQLGHNAQPQAPDRAVYHLDLTTGQIARTSLFTSYIHPSPDVRYMGMESTDYAIWDRREQRMIFYIPHSLATPIGYGAVGFEWSSTSNDWVIIWNSLCVAGGCGTYPFATSVHALDTGFHREFWTRARWVPAHVVPHIPTGHPPSATLRAEPDKILALNRKPPEASLAAFVDVMPPSWRYWTYFLAWDALWSPDSHYLAVVVRYYDPQFDHDYLSIWDVSGAPVEVAGFSVPPVAQEATRNLQWRADGRFVRYFPASGPPLAIDTQTWQLTDCPDCADPPGTVWHANQPLAETQDALDIPLHTQRLHATGYDVHPDGTLVALGDWRGRVSLRTYPQLEPLIHLNRASEFPIFSPDGEWLAVVGYSREVTLWRVDDLLARPLR